MAWLSLSNGTLGENLCLWRTLFLGIWCCGALSNGVATFFIMNVCNLTLSYNIRELDNCVFLWIVFVVFSFFWFSSCGFNSNALRFVIMTIPVLVAHQSPFVKRIWFTYPFASVWLAFLFIVFESACYFIRSFRTDRFPESLCGICILQIAILYNASENTRICIKNAFYIFSRLAGLLRSY